MSYEVAMSPGKKYITFFVTQIHNVILINNVVALPVCDTIKLGIFEGFTSLG